MLRECVCRSQLRDSRALQVADVVLLVVEDCCVFSLQARLGFIVTRRVCSWKHAARNAPALIVQWASEQLVALAEAQADLPVVVVSVKGNSTEAAHATAEVRPLVQLSDLGRTVSRPSKLAPVVCAQVNDLCTSLALPEAHRYTPARAGHLREAALAAALVRGVSLSPAAAPLPLAAPAGRKRDRVPAAPGPGAQAPEKFAPKTLAQRQALQRMLRLRRALGASYPATPADARILFKHERDRSDRLLTRNHAGYTLSGVGIVGGGVMLYRWTRHSLA